MNNEKLTSEELEIFLNSDDALFHYTKRSTTLENILFEGCFKLFKLMSTNDPLEYKTRLKSISYWGNNNLDDSAFAVLGICEHLIKNSYFSSFCMNNSHEDLYGYSKSRMWSQYGENHYGVCLVFSKKSIIDSLSSDIHKSQFCTFVNAIDYAREDKKALHINLVDDQEKSEFNIALAHIKKYSDELFFKKNTDYKDENEYRLILCASSEQKAFTDDECVILETKKYLKAVILGDRFPKVYLETVRNLCTSLNVESRKIYFNNDECHLLELD